MMKLLSSMISDIDMSKPIIVLGASGHAKVLIEALRQSGREILGLTDPAKAGASDFFGVNILGDDDTILNYSPDEVVLVNGIGAMPDNNLRRKLNDRLEEKGFQFSQVIHPSAVVASDVEIDKGAQIMAGVVIQPGVSIGRSCIINTGANVDHDCVIHDGCHLAPGVTLSGNVVINKRTHIGAGTSVIQGITIGQDCVIAAGSIIYKNISENTKYIQLREEKQLGESV